MLSKLLLCFAVSAVLHFTSSFGQTCSPSACCSSSQTCCLNGCCRSSFPVCCSQYASCCPSNFPTCCPNRRCCPANSPCCSNGCCPVAYPVCCSTHCCPRGSYCCGSRCCINIRGRSTRGIPGEEEELVIYSTQAVDIVRTNETIAQFGETLDADEIAHHSILTRQATINGPCNTYARMRLNEGYRTSMYRDSEGIRTIGVGFNLEKDGARQQIESVGANYNAVFNGVQSLTDSQIRRLFNMDMNTAVRCVVNWLPNWRSLGVGPQSALADMAFNLGCTRLRRFICLRKALLPPTDFGHAVEEMRDSRWCGQVGQRCSRDIACMRQNSG